MMGEGRAFPLLVSSPLSRDKLGDASMTTTYCKIFSSCAVLLAAAIPSLCEAGTMGDSGAKGNAGLMGQPRQQPDPQCIAVTERPLSDFLSAQGTTSPEFFPPVKNYVGWTGGPFFALVDYAGFANEYIKAEKQGSLGTNVIGYVKECQLDDSVRVTVGTFTTRALAFAQSLEALLESNLDFDGTPAIFGVKAKDVTKSADAAAGSASLTVTFPIKAPGDPLPDLVDVLNDTEDYVKDYGYAPVSVTFSSSSSGDCTGESRRGQKVQMHVQQVGATGSDGVMTYSVEKVEIVEPDGGKCLD